MTIQEYIDTVSKRYQSGISREHSYRADLENLLRTLVQGVDITNEPANVTDCGNPDYVITNGKIPIGFIEAKDVGKDLKSKQYKEQFDRYRKALDNLIITDYLYFRFYLHGELVHEIKLGEITEGKVSALPDNYIQFENLIKNFCTFIGQTIKSSKKLASMMAAKARLLQNILERAVTSDEETQEDSSIKGQYKTFKDILIHDLTPKGFADIYAQTLAYGMFAARLHDKTLEDFSRQEAAELIPKTNPFLRKLFHYIAGYDIDERIKTTVDNLADVFRAADVDAILHNFGKSTQMHDPIIHFYEDFLAEYDPKLRKSRGVWYTPEPVVNFIVRAVDDILKTEFDLKDGLADTSKTKITVNTQTRDKRSKTGYKQIEQEVHNVQILDPATGTGTFLSEVVKFIYEKRFKAMQGVWNSYVENDLIPRLNGFELLMASYSMAHLKLDMLLQETGYNAKQNKRFNIFLTNSLEEYHPDTGTLFSQWLSAEANEANRVKRDTPVMCIIGNPPYSGESANKGKWIMDLMEDYKKEPGGKTKLQERNPKWINDDYVKFLRYGQHYIEKKGSGILAYINPHGFLDNPTFRGMRWQLLKTYDKIYIIDLHGNSKKKETAPDGSPDINVFDIQQGVSINIFVKSGEKKTNDLGEIFHYDLFGKREIKYNFLNQNNLSSIPFIQLLKKKPNYFMVKKDFELEDSYNKGFMLNDLFPINNVGIVTSRDSFVIDDSRKELKEKIQDFFDSDKESLIEKYNLRENKSWKIDKVKQLAKKFNEDEIVSVNYRPFDEKLLYYNTHFIERSRTEVMQHFTNKNIGLIIGRQGQVVGSMQWNLAFITKSITDFNLYYRGGGNTYPLYLYQKTNGQENFKLSSDRTPNLNYKIVNQIETILNQTFTNEEEEIKNTFVPLDLLDYIYAILHSPYYRERYKEFLKIDFPQIPYPKNKETFWQLVELGGEIRRMHLLESSKVEEYITGYPKDGNNQITRKIAKKDWELTDEKTGKIWINDEQYFENIPILAWEFYIGGYQPAQKWLKDRKGRELSFDDILHYQKIIVALTETDRLMKEIDKIEIE